MVVPSISFWRKSHSILSLLHRVSPLSSGKDVLGYHLATLSFGCGGHAVVECEGVWLSTEVEPLINQFSSSDKWFKRMKKVKPYRIVSSRTSSQ